MKLFQFLVAAMLLASSAIVLSAPPDPNLPNPPLAVRDANVDGNDWIRVHEQGTANVDIQNAELDVNVTGGEIEVTNTVDVHVDNFPNEQDVYVNYGRLSSVNEVWADHVTAGDGENVTRDFGRTIDATQITVSITDQEGPDGDSEFSLSFYSPLVPGGYGGTPVLRMIDYSADLLYESLSFSYPIPLYGLKLHCANEAEDCNVAVTVFGFTGD